MSIVTSNTGVPYMMLKDFGRYYVDLPDGSQIVAVFRARTRKQSFFTVAVAEWTYPNGDIYECVAQPITKELVYNRPFDFGMELRNAVWYAPLRSAGLT